MKVIDILGAKKVGTIITDRRVLSTLKRRGLIYGYSDWGYLESAKLHYWESDGYCGSYYCDLFPKGNAPKERDTDFEDVDKVFAYIGRDIEIEYMGYKFRTKYLDGCFNAYLQLVEKNGNREMEVNPRMSLYGNVI